MKQILFTLLILSSASLLRAQSNKNSATAGEGGLSSQTGWKLGLSVNPGWSPDSRGTGFVLGGALSLYKNLKPNLEATFSAGLTHFFYTNSEIERGSLVPVKAGLQYALNRRFYVAAQAGVAFSTSDGGAYFTYSPTVGLKMSKHFDAGLKYDHFSNEPAVFGLNLTYRVGL